MSDEAKKLTASEGSEVFFFLSQGRQLFGILHPPTGRGREEGIIMCYPAPQDMMRLHQAHVQLSRQLAELGYTVLRFDYSCTGDSDGPSHEASLDAWELDTIAALTWLKQNLKLSRITLFGARLGGTIALRASTQGGIAQLVLWDPVLDGLAYLQELQSSHQQMLNRDAVNPPFHQAGYSDAQSWGFPLTTLFRAQLASISPTMLSTYAKKVHLLASDESSMEWLKIVAKQGPRVEHHQTGEAMHWNDDRFFRVRAFPAVTLRTILRILGGT